MESLKNNLTNLIVVIQDMKNKLKEAENQDVILAIGSTGCGKSTMLNSLIWGPESMSLKSIDQDLILRDGTKKIIKRKVIESNDPRPSFKIGHSAS